MANISAIKLPNGSTYDLVDKKSGYVQDVEVNGESVVEEGVAGISLYDYVKNSYEDTFDSIITTYDGESGGHIQGYNNSSGSSADIYWSVLSGDNLDEALINFEADHIQAYGFTPTSDYDITTKKYVDDTILALPSPMLFKGSVGTGGTISTLPAAAASNEGFTYKVITELSTPVVAKVGDTVISNGSNWIVIPSGDEPSGTVTSIGLSNATYGGLSISGSPITSSGTISVGHSNVLTSAQTTSGIYPIKIDKNGHITEYGTAVTIPTKTSDLTNDSGFMAGMTILSYGSSTWQNFIDAYSDNKVVYCRASSNANPASGSQTRLAFMAYVNNATTPTNVEFQYYRSVSTHTASQQGDQVFVYKLDKTAGWSVTTREASVKVVAGTGLGGTYSNGTMTLTGPTKVSDLTNDSGFITSYTETDPIFTASAAYGISSSDITSWDGKQAALVSGTNIKTINNESILGSGNIDIQTGALIAIYGSTSYTDISTAYTNNQPVFCRYNYGMNSLFIPLTTFNVDDSIFYFSKVYNNSCYVASISSEDEWSFNYNDIQAKLVSGTNIKTINSTSILGSGDISITDNKVVQSASTSNSPQPILFRNNVGTSASDSTEGTRYATAVTITPSTGDISATKFNGYTLAEACAKTVDTSISANSSSANLPTSSAVASFVEGKGYITSYTETDPIFTASAAHGITSSDITNWNGKQAALVSGTNIKTVNNESLLGSGNITVSAEDEIFVAEYNLTPYSYVEDAYTHGKTVICKYVSYPLIYYLPLTFNDPLGFVFSAFSVDDDYFVISLDSTDVWSFANRSPKSTPTASTMAKFDSNAQMNSTDMSSQDVSDFVDSLNTSSALSVAQVIADMFVTSSHNINVGKISGNGYSASSASVTKSGYTPIGIVGFRIQSSYIQPSRIQITGYNDGSATVSWEMRNYASGAVNNMTLTVEILWRKTI